MFAKGRTITWHKIAATQCSCQARFVGYWSAGLCYLLYSLSDTESGLQVSAVPLSSNVYYLIITADGIILILFIVWIVVCAGCSKPPGNLFGPMKTHWRIASWLVAANQGTNSLIHMKCLSCFFCSSLTCQVSQWVSASKPSCIVICITTLIGNYCANFFSFWKNILLLIFPSLFSFFVQDTPDVIWQVTTLLEDN